MDEFKSRAGSLRSRWGRGGGGGLETLGCRALSSHVFRADTPVPLYVHRGPICDWEWGKGEMTHCGEDTATKVTPGLSGSGGPS